MVSPFGTQPEHSAGSVATTVNCPGATKISANVSPNCPLSNLFLITQAQA